VYIPISQLASPVVAREFHVMVRTSGDPLMLARPLQQAIWKHDRNLPIFGVAPLADVQSSEFVLERTGAALGTAFATFGALLSVFGILGILSYTVTQARFDWGVRLALGAAPLDVLNTLMLRGLVLVGAGAVIGVLGGTLLTGVLRQLLTGIEPLSVLQMVLLPTTLVVLGAAACFIPARRASRIAPLILLRE
jgi:ABC-type antimicrobial peptide transport system permease subunit